MVNAYQKRKGDVVAHETYNGDAYFVVHDREKSEPYSQERANNRWQVVYVPKSDGPKGLKELFKSEGAAKNRAVKCAQHVQPLTIFGLSK
jgi:hypothetical protein